LEVPPDETPGLMTLQTHHTNVLQSITYAKSAVTKKTIHGSEGDFCGWRWQELRQQLFF